MAAGSLLLFPERLKRQDTFYNIQRERGCCDAFFSPYTFFASGHPTTEHEIMNKHYE